MTAKSISGAIATNNTHDGAWRDAEAEIVDQQPVTKAFAKISDLDHLLAQPGTRWNENFMCFIAFLVIPGIQLFEALQTRLAFCLPPLAK